MVRHSPEEDLLITVCVIIVINMAGDYKTLTKLYVETIISKKFVLKSDDVFTHAIHRYNIKKLNISLRKIRKGKF